MTPQRSAPWLVPAFVAFALVTLAVLMQGQDANWDLRNYHLYTPIALMDGRLDQDIAAAQLQTWHNPVLDFPLAWLVRAGASGWLVSLWLALPAFIALLFALRLMDGLWPAQRSTLRTVVAGLVAVSGAAVLSGTGTSFNDAFVAAGVLPALWWAVDSQGRRGVWATWLPVGLLAGAAAGLKLTAAMYCVGFAAAAMVAGPLRSLPARLLALAVGGIVAASITAGPWAWRLWLDHGNPLFPYFNQWFQSPDALSLPYKDERFLPLGWFDRLMVPFHLLVSGRRYSETSLADPRLLLGLIAMGAWIFQWLKARRETLTQSRTASSPWLTVVFAVVSYCIWVYLYGIYRYLYALDLVLAVLLVGMLSASVPGRFHKTALVVCMVVVIAVTDQPKWGRQPFSSPMVSVRFPALAHDSLVVLAEDEPLGHAVAFLPSRVAAISVYNNFMDPERCTRLQAKAEARIRQHGGPMYLLRTSREVPATHGRYEVYGLSISGECLPVADSLVPLQLCPLSREVVIPPRCPWSAPGR